MDTPARGEGPADGAGERRGLFALRDRQDALERALLALVAVVIAGSALAIGAVHTPVLVPVAALSIAAALVAVPLRQTVAPGRAWPAPAMVLLALSLYTALQAVPLPLTVLEKIAPANADIWARSLLPLGERPAWGSVSLDPGATLIEALKWLSYACMFLASATLAGRRGTAFVIALVFGSATLLAIVTLLHGMTGATKVFGVYQPAGDFAPHHVGPLLNTNNLAGYLNLGALAGVGLMLMHRPLLRPWLVGLGVAIDIAAAVRAASRGGVAALLLGVLLLAVLVRKSRGSRSGSRRQRLAPLLLAGGTVTFGGALALLGGDVWVWRELYNDNLAKLKIVLWTGPLLRAHGWLGVGRGAFESVFEAYRPSTGYHVIYTHPENFPAQWASEWGIPVAAAALLAFFWFFRPTALGVTRSSVVAAGWVAVLALLIQNLADLGLEIPAVALAATSVLGALWADPSRVRRKERTLLDRAVLAIGPRPLSIGVAVTGALLTVLALAYGLRDVKTQRDVMRDRYERADDDPAQRPSFREALRAAMMKRPAEHYFPLLGAAAAVSWRDQKPMPWLQHTLERAPVNGRAHMLLARVLAQRGARGQALFELRLAVEYEPGLADTAAPLATALAKTFEELLSAVPDGKAGAEVLSMMARRLTQPEQAEMRRDADRAALARDPTLIEPRRRALGEIFTSITELAQGRAPGAACATLDACAADVERHAASIEAAQPDSSLGVVVRARGLIAQGARDKAEDLLVGGCARPEGREECLQVRVENLAHLKDAAKLEAALKEYLSNGCTTAPSCAAASTFVGQVRMERGDYRAAAAAFVRAAEEEPSEERWLRAADAAERAKMNVQAIEALQRVASMRGGDPEIAARIVKLKEAAAAQMIRF